MNYNNDKFPLVFLQSWLWESVEKCIDPSRRYTSSLIKKNFVDETPRKASPIVRISKFIKVTDNKDLTVILSDSTNLMFAIFPFKPTIVNFEDKYKQRITFHTQNILIHIKKANLRFIERKDYPLYEIPAMGLSMVVLEVLDLEIFQRDQIMLSNKVESTLKFLHNESNYESLFGRKWNNAEENNDREDYDDVVSF
ncbi:predicted protein [Scheffersomyces stipitis CBS 6054]|uniref:Telomere replication protein EST3 n=1 Tax=Scheffersomyces stipitis (strain ATCC 58785 / CBS 6054 / NBRC 10063 / NRRL Y-11545) TaxID=322104 RepID=A3LNH7_PICST|nr:predicted protein [Scheffersomyces stipitis CBS 6054]ABN64335.2 predicted protein [Scheffersomyces stipitis CBS 6054]KAG2736216.1 hypothetical protein G9P44_000306 [Scheffersomyces stipitis]